MISLNTESKKMKNIQEALTFDDLMLVPKYSDIKSRTEVDLSSILDFNITLKTPFFSSPMTTVTEELMVLEMNRLGGMGIIHRYNTIEEQVSLLKNIKNADKNIKVGAAIGATGDFYERAQELIKENVDLLCIDVAHGHSIHVKNALYDLNANMHSKYREKVHIMAGSIATGEAYIQLKHWGADSARVGIGGSKICSTRINTGHGVPNMSAIFDCVNMWTKVFPNNYERLPIIIDGGIKKPADMVKALAAGADFIMCGSLFAGTTESAGKVHKDSKGKEYKNYSGMASTEEQTKWRGYSSSPEGIVTKVPFKGKLETVINNIVGNVKSGFSYSGARNIKELRENAEFVKQTSSGIHEGMTHEEF
jgi:IMP dehydrogenase